MIKKWSIEEVKSIIFNYEHKQVDLFNNAIDLILKNNQNKQPTMIELGAAEGLYSMLFDEYFSKQNIFHKNICLELMPHKVEQLKENLPNAIIYHGFVGNIDLKDGDFVNLVNLFNNSIADTIKSLKHYTLKELMNLSDTNYADILHVDTQGAEFNILKEIKDNNMYDNFRFYFISSHNIDGINTHETCEQFFNNMSSKQILLNDPFPFNGSGYGDGLLVVENLNYKTG